MKMGERVQQAAREIAQEEEQTLLREKADAATREIEFAKHQIRRQAELDVEEASKRLEDERVARPILERSGMLQLFERELLPFLKEQEPDVELRIERGRQGGWIHQKDIPINRVAAFFGLGPIMSGGPYEIETARVSVEKVRGEGEITTRITAEVEMDRPERTWVSGEGIAAELLNTGNLQGIEDHVARMIARGDHKRSMPRYSEMESAFPTWDGM